MKPLHLNLKGEYFEQIKSGEKKEEYRLYNEFWKRRLLGRDYSSIIIKLGYPKQGDSERTIVRPWKGFVIKEIQHKHFGDEPVKVFAIQVNK